MQKKSKQILKISALADMKQLVLGMLGKGYGRKERNGALKQTKKIIA